MSQRGNILFLILLAVVLFAALAYAVTSSMNGSGKNAAQEKEQLDNAVTDNCTALIENSIERLKIVKGCTTDQISYELINGINANPQAPVDKHCHLFHPSGAGATPCGDYTEPMIATGNITASGDTTTIVLLPGPTYMRCPTWNGVNCEPRFSLDGTNFVNSNKTCMDKDDDARGMMDLSTMADMLCSAACGGNYAGGNLDFPAPPMDLYMADSGAMVPYTTGNCENTFASFRCNCW